MLGTRIFTLSLLLSAAVAAQDYFPLQPGNLWVYRTAIGAHATLEIERTEQVGPNTYSLLKGLPSGDAWLRSDNSGKVWAYDAATRSERLWYDFSAAAGASYETSVPGSAGTARIETRNGPYRGPLGDFMNALIIQYPAARVPGVEREVFLPYVGLVHRGEIGGVAPAFWELMYASLGGIVHLRTGDVSFEMALHSAFPMPRMLMVPSVRLTVRNSRPAPLVLDFNSGQRFDVRAYNDKGEIVWTWSSTRLFPAAVGQERVVTEKSWVAELPQLPPGNYAIEGYLTTSGGPVYRATLPLTVPAPR